MFLQIWFHVSASPAPGPAGDRRRLQWRTLLNQDKSGSVWWQCDGRIHLLNESTLIQHLPFGRASIHRRQDEFHTICCRYNDPVSSRGTRKTNAHFVPLSCHTTLSSHVQTAGVVQKGHISVVDPKGSISLVPSTESQWDFSIGFGFLQKISSVANNKNWMSTSFFAK